MARALLSRGVALRKLVEKLTPKPVEELDRAKLDQFRSGQSCARIDEISERQRVRVGGEVKAVRIVPRAGADALEVQLTDGHGSVTAVFLGRRKIAGMSPGRKVVVEGLTMRDRRRLLLYNPVYELH
jgi:RecG-like helicase